MSLGDSSADDGEGRVGSLGSEALGDEVVEPGGRDRVGLERLRLEELDEVLDGRPEVSSDRELLERDDHVLPTL